MGGGGGEDREKAATGVEKDGMLWSREEGEDRKVELLLLLRFRETGDMATTGNEWNDVNLRGCVM